MNIHIFCSFFPALLLRLLNENGNKRSKPRKQNKQTNKQTPKNKTKRNKATSAPPRGVKAYHPQNDRKKSKKGTESKNTSEGWKKMRGSELCPAFRGKLADE